jgi:hypothetical protein
MMLHETYVSVVKVELTFSEIITKMNLVNTAGFLILP